MELNEHQLKIAKHYYEGEFNFVKTLDDVNKCGDGLFVFLINEADEVEDKEDFLRRINTARNELTTLCMKLDMDESDSDLMDSALNFIGIPT